MEVITTHLNADFDAMASMVAAKKLYPNAVLVFPGSQERTLREFFVSTAGYLFDFKKLKNVDLDQIERLILVDTRQASRIGKFAEIVDRPGLDIHIYDHHPDAEDDVRGSLAVIEPTGATVTILTGRIRDRGLPVTDLEATILLLGIFEDTGSFTFSSTTPADFEAAAFLLKCGADLNMIADLVTRELTAEQVGILNELIRSARTYNIQGIEICVASVSVEKYVGDFAILVHKLKDMENLNVIFALARMEDRVYLVARSRLPAVDVGEIAAFFGGGGHASAASATIRELTLIQAEDRLFELLQSMIHPAINARQLMSRPVIFVAPETTIGRAEEVMVRYNINAMPVVEQGVVRGLLNHQVLDKAIFHGLKSEPVREYMNQDFSVVEVGAPLMAIQKVLVEHQQRILPVLEQGELVGVVTRRDLLNFMINDRSNTPKALHGDGGGNQWGRRKNMTSLMLEQLPADIIRLLRDFGELAERLHYRVYAVGGFIRDLLLRRPNLDIDVVVEGDGVGFAKAFAEQHGVRARCHSKFNTAVLVLDQGLKVDVATARLEYYQYPAALPVVEFGSLKLDLYRRDFTINTLAIALTPDEFGQLIDFFGGQRDLKDRVIRVLHSLSFVEDPTRILRAIRFEQRFGFRIGKQTAGLIQNAVKIELLARLGGQRLYHELQHIFTEENPLPALRRMDEFGVLAVVFTGLRFDHKAERLFNRIKQVISWYHLSFLAEPLDGSWLYFLGLLALLPASARADTIAHLDIPEAGRERIERGFTEGGRLLDQFFKLRDPRPSAIYRALQPFKAEEILFMMAATEKDEVARTISRYFHRHRYARTELKGRDLLALGVPPGPIYTVLLNELLDARVNGEVDNRDQELAFISARLQAMTENPPAPAPSAAPPGGPGSDRDAS
ncbi:MAG: polya polymerase [Syntrophobacteraceae bacterium CG2_30_61_12]|nr:MAG: polya polymerase [Syntrophobacteraceae bacterium CG2_30_61_12]PIU31961.1 MAG: polya polymerase [Syntrophobacteraceae bacterium CG07_land_8_20_14_0_80_61_8]